MNNKHLLRRAVPTTTSTEVAAFCHVSYCLHLQDDGGSKLKRLLVCTSVQSATFQKTAVYLNL
jgi:hypothetical protein